MRPFVAVLLACLSCLAADKNDLKHRYEKKFVVILRDGLAVGTCSSHAAKLFEMPTLAVRIEGDKAEYHVQGGASSLVCGSGPVIPEPVRKGEVLKVERVYMRGEQFSIFVRNLSPHAVRRGAGAFEHDSLENGRAELRFTLPNPSDLDASGSLIESWVKPFDTSQQAAEFGNTASGVFVKQVKTGMSFAEVESALGLPQTRVDLGEKVLYKYKDMTVEFQKGKVTDVR